MKEYKIYYTTTGTIFEYNKAWVKAESEDEAIKALQENDWDKILETEAIDTDYEDDFHISQIESVDEVGEYEDQ